MNRKDLQRPINDLLQDIEQGQTTAIEQLWLWLEPKKMYYQTAKQQFPSYEAEDIYFTAFEGFCAIIKKGNFMPKGTTEIHRKNQTRNFFRQIVRTVIKEFRRPALATIDEHFPPIPVLPKEIKEASLVKQLLDLLEELGEICSKLLTNALVYDKSNKEIAKLQLALTLADTAQVTARKKDCLNKLYKDFSYNLTTLEAPVKEAFIHTSLVIQQDLEEPCASILKLLFQGKNNREMVAMLPMLLSPELAKDYRTADQVKKKKSRCLNSFREAIFKKILE